MRRRLPFIGALAAVAAIAVVLTLVLAGGGDEPAERAADARPPAGAKTLDGDGFSLFYPGDWARLPARSLGEGQARAQAGLKRTDDQGLVLVQRRGPLEAREDRKQLIEDLDERLGRQFEDFRRTDAEEIELAGEPAVSFTFVRTETGRVQNIVVVPGEERTWTLNTVLPAGADEAARQAAQIVRSFKPDS